MTAAAGAGMRRSVGSGRASPRPLTCAAALLPVLAGAGCGRLEELRQEPPILPAEWCTLRPCVDLGGVVLSEPLGTFLVFLLALLWVAAGGYFLATQATQRSRVWLGVALLLGGIGAAQAGISYQAFGYELKCAGRAECLLTNGFEVGYSVTQALSVSAMLTAVAIACTSGALRRGLVAYAALNAAAYVGVTAAGVALPSRALLSFEVLMLFALPGLVAVIGISALRWMRSGGAVDRALLVAALLLAAVQAAYFSYQAAGITQRLWDEGRCFYFSENDVLHVGMLLWLGYLVAALGPRLRDFAPGEPPVRA